MTEEELDNLLIHQKDHILRLINEHRYQEAQTAVNILFPLWDKAGYSYKTRELDTLIEERSKSGRS